MREFERLQKEFEKDPNEERYIRVVEVGNRMAERDDDELLLKVAEFYLDIGIYLNSSSSLHLHLVSYYLFFSFLLTDINKGAPMNKNAFSYLQKAAKRGYLS